MNNLLANLKHFVSHLILLFMLLSCIIVFIIKKRELDASNSLRRSPQTSAAILIIIMPYYLKKHKWKISFLYILSSFQYFYLHAYISLMNLYSLVSHSKLNPPNRTSFFHISLNPQLPSATYFLIPSEYSLQYCCNFREKTTF